MKVKGIQASLIFSHALQHSNHQTAGVRHHRVRIHRSDVPNVRFPSFFSFLFFKKNLHPDIVHHLVCSRGKQCTSARKPCLQLQPNCPVSFLVVAVLADSDSLCTVIVRQHWQTAAARLRKRSWSLSHTVRDVFCNLKGTGHGRAAAACVFKHKKGECVSEACSLPG